MAATEPIIICEDCLSTESEERQRAPHSHCMMCLARLQAGAGFCDRECEEAYWEGPED